MNVLRQHKPLASIVLAGTAALLIVVSFIALTSGLIFDYPVSSPKLTLNVSAIDPTSPVALENRHSGTGAWQLDVGANMTYIQGYVGAVSALPGETVPLFISSVAPIHFDLAVYRIGWYGGLGGRLMFAEHNLASLAQGTWTAKTGLVGCHSCSMASTTHLVEANWKSDAEVTIGPTWLSGVYLIKLTAANHAESYIPLVVRADTSYTSVLASLPVNTYQAYNTWGDYSLYESYDPEGGITSNRAYAVSFDRPYDRSAGAGDFLAWDIHTVRWMERSDLDASYTTDVDVSEQPNLLLQHRIFLAMGHDEYWSLSMRNGVEAARNQGVSLAFLGADDSYWQNRYGPDQAGHPDRTVICYKVSGQSPLNPASLPRIDPAYPNYMNEVTAQWRDPLLRRPESTLLGLEYHSLFRANYHPAWVVSNHLAPLEAGTGLRAGEHITGGLLGYEYDGLGPSKDTPSNLVKLAESPVTSYYGVKDTAISAYYMAKSGAIVFDAGSIWWSWGLDEFTPIGAYQRNVLKGNSSIAKLMVNILNAMLAASPQAPARSATPVSIATPIFTPTAALIPTPTPKN